MADESTYPAVLDGDLRALVPAATTPAGFEDFLQLLADAVGNIEVELGTDPSGAAATLAARLAALQVTLQAAFVADSGALTSTDVVAANANVQTGAYVQADVESIRTVANELKADFNLLRADVTALRTKVNAILAALRGVGKPMAAA